jgi:hypothetical protein
MCFGVEVRGAVHPVWCDHSQQCTKGESMVNTFEVSELPELPAAESHVEINGHCG